MNAFWRPFRQALHAPRTLASRNACSFRSAPIHPRSPFPLNLRPTSRRQCSNMSSSKIAPHDENRLPTNLKPLHYDLVVATDLEKRVFSGAVAVDLLVIEDTSDVVLNVKDLDVGPATLLYGDKTLTQASSNIDTAKSRLSISFSETLKKGDKVRLRLPYAAKLTDQMIGYYFSTYEHEGQKKIIALTQFEPVEARRAFPCWDEPALKATFGVTMISQPDTVNLSNMPVTRESLYVPTFTSTHSDIIQELKLHEGRWKITIFEPTPLMSSYLVAYANGHFKHIESSYTSPLSGKTRPLRAYGTPDCVEKLAFALEVKAKALPIYEKVFDIEYPLPKLDTLVANQFDAGAMENWGLITGRTSIYLYDPAKSDLQSKKRVVEVQSHECAHMWFGNVVSPTWWQYLYLNEGFASLMGEVIILDKLYPEWKANSAFINIHLNRALELDAKRSSHPIEVPIAEAETINQIFDALSYSKAASILRMLVSVVGEEKFLKGVSTYLKRNLYGNTETKDLWDGIQEATGFDVPALMDNWVLKIGYPVLTVTETPNGITVRQDRFLDTGDTKENENETIWHVPLQLRSTDSAGKSTVDSTLILREREGQFALDTKGAWKLNANTNGPYRVAYSAERWAKIAQELARKDTSFTTEDRMGLVSDVFSLAQAGYGKTSSALELLSGLKNETEYLVWQAAGGSLGPLLQAWWNQPDYEQLNAFRGSLYKPVVDRLGLEFKAGDDVDTTQLRAYAITQAAFGQDPEVLAHLKALYAKFVETKDESIIPADILRTTLIVAIRRGGEAEFEHVKSLYLAPTSTPTVKLGSISALCNAINKPQIDGAFKFLQSDAESQDWPYFFIALSGNRQSRRALAEFLFENYETLRTKFDGTSIWGNLVKYAFINLTTLEDIEKINKFFENKDCSKFDLSLKQSLDSIRTSAAWLERSKTDVAEWLQKRASA